MTEIPEIDLDIPIARAFTPLLKPARFKGIDGGRGSAKSHTVASILINDVVRGHQRVACAREYQNAIADSSKQLIEDKIRKFGLMPNFRITEREIVYIPTDSLFVFKGLHGQSAESFKSMEGYTRLWNEEAQTTSQRSLDLLYPTFRAGSQQYYTWNAGEEDDPVDVFFKESVGDKNFIHLHVDYNDNPWFMESDLYDDMERDRKRDQDKYAHIWLGKYKQLSEARVFKNWAIRHFETPDDAQFRFGADWGFSNDPTVLVRCFIDPSDENTLYVDQEAYKVGCKITDTPELFKKIDGSRKWPIRADSARPETIDYMRDNGFKNMEHALKGAGSVADGVEFLKSFDIIVHPRCVHTSDELSFYSYKKDKKTNKILPVLEDKKNHVIDSLRYAVEALRRSKSLQITPEFVNALKSMGRSSRHHRRQL